MSPGTASSGPAGPGGADAPSPARKRLVVRVIRERALDTGELVWTGLLRGYPGSAGGRTIAELAEEIDAVKHFLMAEDASTQITVDYVYDHTAGTNC